MRGRSLWLVIAALGIATLGSMVVAPASPAGAQDIEDPIPAPSAPELAPGASPGTPNAESGPVLTYEIPDGHDTLPTDTLPTDNVPALTDGEPSSEEMPPAGPVLLSDTPLGSGGLDNSTRFTLLVVMLTAVPSFTVGTALWLYRGDGAARRTGNRRSS